MKLNKLLGKISFHKISKYTLLIGFILIIGRIALKQTDGFTILSITPHHPFDPLWEVRPCEKNELQEIDQLLSQPFTYFGCGGQAFTFFSADQKYVIKFFRQRLFKPSFILNNLPLPKFLHRFRQKRNFKRWDKLYRDFYSYKVSFEDLQKETGVVFVHLNPTNHLKRTVTLIDRLGISHHVDLDRMDFVIQKRAELVYDRIIRLMKEDKIEEAKLNVERILSLIVTRCKKGYHDRDPNIRTNCGFIGNQPIKIDVGRFVKNEIMKNPLIYREELKRIAAPFKDWLEKNYPSLSLHLQQFIQQLSEEPIPINSFDELSDNFRSKSSDRL